MNKTLLTICCIVLLAGCTATQFSTYTPKNVDRHWKITGSKAPITNKISIAINDSVVATDKPAAFANTIDAKGTYQGHEVHFFSTYNNGILEYLELAGKRLFSLTTSWPHASHFELKHVE